MCGIIGVTGVDDALPLLLEGLGRLEYRGYDSAGVVLVAGDALWRTRAAEGTHSVRDLRLLGEEAPPRCSGGVGHTRWATHGGPTTGNAHPHMDCTGRLALVHNGIIENHTELAGMLVADGHVLASDTDSEVLPHLIEAEMAGGLGLAEGLRNVLRNVRGSFAVAAVHADDPELVVAARRVSPLIVGLGEGTSFLASDIPALLGSTRQLFALEDDQLVELRPGSMRVTTLDGADARATALNIDWDVAAARLGGHDDFMTKEIHEQPAAVAATLLGHRRDGGRLALDEAAGLSERDLRAIERVCIVACGSSYHAALVAKYAIEQWARLPTEVDIASEFRYRNPVLNNRTLTIGVSQSGETVDTLQSLREAGVQGSKVLVVSNVVDSSMAREADGVLYTRAGPEIGVAASKTHLTQIVALELLALVLAQARRTLSVAEISCVMDQMLALPDQIDAVLQRTDDVAAVAGHLAGARDFFYLGRHVGHPVAMEGALKLKEISYLRAEGYPGGELKHGPIALIEPGTVVVGVATRNPLWEKMCSNIQEVKSRGATIVLVGSDGDDQTAALADHMLWVPSVEPMLSPVVDVVPLQFLAYWLAQAHGHDVDRPRNLAKTVTVE
ncbi:MAG: glutamine--fructose-6-phosphate transaminase (isomerizing) [Acidimicrobiales bacterium]|jgi:glucosamine--fructose-6-phosphate aminotransferase (isomerizing)